MRVSGLRSVGYTEDKPYYAVFVASAIVNMSWLHIFLASPHDVAWHLYLPPAGSGPPSSVRPMLCVFQYDCAALLCGCSVLYEDSQCALSRLISSCLVLLDCCFAHSTFVFLQALMHFTHHLTHVTDAGTYGLKVRYSVVQRSAAHCRASQRSVVQFGAAVL